MVGYESFIVIEMYDTHFYIAVSVYLQEQDNEILSYVSNCTKRKLIFVVHEYPFSWYQYLSPTVRKL